MAMPTLITRCKGQRVVLRQEHYNGPFSITVDNSQEADKVYRISYSHLNHPVNALTEVMELIQKGAM